MLTASPDPVQALAEWIWATNAVHRGSFSDDQKFAIRVKISAWEKEQAKQRQIAQGNRGKEGGRGNKKTLASKSSQGFPKPKRAPDERTRIASDLKTASRRRGGPW